MHRCDCLLCMFGSVLSVLWEDFLVIATKNFWIIIFLLVNKMR